MITPPTATPTESDQMDNLWCYIESESDYFRVSIPRTNPIYDLEEKFTTRVTPTPPLDCPNRLFGRRSVEKHGVRSVVQAFS